MKKSALQKIESHEKLCRIMQKQTFEQIKEMKDRIKRLEYMDRWRYGFRINSFTHELYDII